MELPFYLSYNEFENHYYNNLEKWFEQYHNTSEIDYLKSLAELYSPYLYYNFANDSLQADASIQIADCIDQKLRSVQAFEYTIYKKLKSEAKFKVEVSHQFLTMCN